MMIENETSNRNLSIRSIGETNISPSTFNCTEFFKKLNDMAISTPKENLRNVSDRVFSQEQFTDAYDCPYEILTGDTKPKSHDYLQVTASVNESGTQNYGTHKSIH
jgi:hypothetical protein